jgi:hypothetical protein
MGRLGEILYEIGMGEDSEFLCVAWECACALIDEGSREGVAGVLAPVAFHQRELIEFAHFTRYLPVFVALTSDDCEDFESNPAVFYRFACVRWGNPMGSVRQEALFIVREFCRFLTNDALAEFIASFDANEAGVKIVTMAISRITERGPGNPACEALKGFLIGANAKGAIEGVAIGLLIAKAVRLLCWDKEVIDLAVSFVVQVLETPQIHPVFVSVLARLLLSFRKIGLAFDRGVIFRLLDCIPHAVSPDLFHLLVEASETARDFCAEMGAIAPELLRKLAEEIGDGDQDDQDDGSVELCRAIFRLLRRILDACGDSDWADPLYSFVTTGFTLLNLDIRHSVASLFRRAVHSGSRHSLEYLAFFTAALPGAADSLADLLPAFIDLMPNGSTTHVFACACDAVNRLIQSGEVRSDEDMFWAAIMVAWAVRMFPGHIDPTMALTSAEVILADIQSEVGPLPISLWLRGVAGYTLLAGGISVTPIDLGPEMVTRWAQFIDEEGLLSVSFVATAATAMGRLAESFQEYEESLGTLLALLTERPGEFVSLRVVADDRPALRRILSRLPPFLS